MSTQHHQPADLVVRGSAVYTLDPARPWAKAPAVRGGKLAVVGDEADVQAVTDSETRVIRAEAGMVMPGLIDVHSPVGFGGKAAAWKLGLSPTLSAEEILSAVRDLGPASSAQTTGWAAAWSSVRYSTQWATRRRWRP